MTVLTLHHLTKTYPRAARPALDGLTVEVPSGRVLALLGPSGCGKSTTLRLIAGLLKPDGGDVRFDGASVLGAPAEQRGAALMFQDHLLFPFISVLDNVGFGLKMRGLPRAEVHRRACEMLELVQLPGLEGRRPAELSGGQQQRVALARALITQPRVLLLDEPLSSLDAHLHDEMLALICDVQQRFSITTVVVTHNQAEALRLADQVALLADGRLQQHAPPPDFYRRPANAWVARFFGGVNFIPASPDAAGWHTPLGVLHSQAAPADSHALLTIRPENVRLGQPGQPNTVRAVLEKLEFRGTYLACLACIDGQRIEAHLPPGIDGLPAPGSHISLHLPPADLWPLPPEAG